MFLRTVRTYFALVSGVLLNYRKVLKAGKKFDDPLAARKYVYDIASGIIEKTLDRAGVELVVTGEENIPKDRNFVLIGNHQSMVDILVILHTIKRPIGFVAKAELKKVPVLRDWMEALGCVFMNRSDLRESMKALLEGIKMVKEGYSLCIFPEGTRTDGKMLEFKGGSFKLATKSGAPILPITIDGTNRILEDNGMWIEKAEVRLTYHPIIETKGMSKEEQNVLSERVQDIVGSALKEEFRFGKNKNIDS